MVPLRTWCCPIAHRTSRKCCSQQGSGSTGSSPTGGRWGCPLVGGAWCMAAGTSNIGLGAGSREQGAGSSTLLSTRSIARVCCMSMWRLRSSSSVRPEPPGPQGSLRGHEKGEPQKEGYGRQAVASGQRPGYGGHALERLMDKAHNIEIDRQRHVRREVRSARRALRTQCAVRTRSAKCAKQPRRPSAMH